MGAIKLKKSKVCDGCGGHNIMFTRGGLYWNEDVGAYEACENAEMTEFESCCDCGSTDIETKRLAATVP